jgi:hypothetical protein
MHDCEDVNAFRKYQIDDSVPAYENLPDLSPLVIGDESSDAREPLQLTGGIEDAIRKQSAGAP